MSDVMTRRLQNKTARAAEVNAVCREADRAHGKDFDRRRDHAGVDPDRNLNTVQIAALCGLSRKFFDCIPT